MSRLASISTVAALFLTLIVQVYSQYSCDVLLPKANVYCISPTEYIKEPGCNQTIYSCSEGQFCTDSEAVCTENGPPVCMLSRACKSCPSNALSTCVGMNEYVTCENGQLNSTVKTYCPASEPYCSMKLNAKRAIVAECTRRIEEIACRGICLEMYPPVTEEMYPPVTEERPTKPTVTTPIAPVQVSENSKEFRVTIDITSNKNDCGPQDSYGAERELNLDISVLIRSKKVNRN